MNLLLSYTFCFRGFFLGEAATSAAAIAGLADIWLVVVTDGVTPFIIAVEEATVVTGTSGGSFFTLAGEEGRDCLAGGWSVGWAVGATDAVGCSPPWLPVSLKENILGNNHHIILSGPTRKKAS